MALNTKNLSKQYYSVTPIQDLEQIDINDLILDSEGEEVDLIPIGLHNRTVSNSISIKDLQSAIDTTGYIPQEAKSGDTLELTIGGLMSQLDKWNLDYLVNLGGMKHLKDGDALGSLRSNLSQEEDETYQLGRGAISLGCDTKASGLGSYALGISDNYWFGTLKTEATGYGSHAEGCGTLASGKGAHALGVLQEGGDDAVYQTEARGEGSHAEGCGTLASGRGSHAEGLSFDGKSAGTPYLYSLKATGKGSHAGGAGTEAIGDYSITQGLRTRATNKSQTVIGEFNIADNTGSSNTRGKYAFIIGNGNDNGFDLSYSNALTVDWDGKVESFGGNPIQDNHLTTKEYVDNTINNVVNNIDIGLQNLEDGEVTGSVQGIASQATGTYSFAEGYGTIASGDYSHAEGTIDDLGRNISSGFASHTEGVDTIASNYAAHAEGAETQAIGQGSHAEGYVTEARGNYSHASGTGTIANNDNEFAIGSYNLKNISPQSITLNHWTPTMSLDLLGTSFDYTITKDFVNIQANSVILVNFTGVFIHANGSSLHISLFNHYFYSFTEGVPETSYFEDDNELEHISEGSLYYDGDSTFYLHLNKKDGSSLNGYNAQLTAYFTYYKEVGYEDNNVFVIGNGTDDSHRSNLFTIEKDTGNIWTPGNITSNNIIAPNATIDTITTNNLNIGQGVNIIDKIFPVESIYTTATNQNPSSFLNGEWTLQRKGLKQAFYNTTDSAVWNNTYTDSSQNRLIYLWTNGDTILLRTSFKIKTTIPDSDINIFRLDGTDFGVYGDLHLVYIDLQVPGRNTILLGYFDTDSNGNMTLKARHPVSRAAAVPNLAGITAGGSAIFKCSPSIMIDRFCDYFEWKRIS